MSRFFITLFTALSILLCNAQEKHLEFNGVAINGTLEGITEDIKASGLKFDCYQGNISMFYGKYLGYETDVIAVFSIPKHLIPFHINVKFKGCDDRDELESQYYNLKESLSALYGRPVETVHKTVFEYSCKFEVPETGIVELKMDINQQDLHCNIIDFTDKQNNIKSEKAMFGDL